MEFIDEIYAVKQAIEVATKAHENQTRADGITPYITHPALVATLVSMYSGNKTELTIVAWLHDVKEDLRVNNRGELIIDEYLQTCGLHYEVASEIDGMLNALTKNNRIVNRDDRNLENLHRILYAHEGVTLVKICDRMANLFDVEHKGRAFALKYLVESKILCGGLSRRAKEFGYHVPLIDLLELIEEKEKTI